MFKNISFLVIDEDINIGYLFKSIFESYNISCTTVTSLEAAELKLECRIPTFVIIDFEQLGGRGVEFVEHLKAKFPCIKIILCDSYNLKLLKNHNVELFQMIEKPFTINKIRSIIDNLKKIPKCTKTVKCFPQDCSNIMHV